jgi:hypothetical protein
MTTPRKPRSKSVPKQPAVLPRWAVTLFAASAGGASVLAVASYFTGAVNTYTAAQTKLASMEAAMVVLAPLPGRLTTLETRFDAQGRVRDQQHQGSADRLRALENADVANLERLQVLTTTIAGLLPRVDEILRRQERLENRLSVPQGTRPGSDDAPERKPALFHAIFRRDD